MYKWIGLDASSASKNNSWDTILAESASRIWRIIRVYMRIVLHPTDMSKLEQTTHRPIEHYNTLPQQSRIYVIASLTPSLT